MRQRCVCYGWADLRPSHFWDPTAFSRLERSPRALIVVMGVSSRPLSFSALSLSLSAAFLGLALLFTTGLLLPPIPTTPGNIYQGNDQLAGLSAQTHPYVCVTLTPS